MMRTFSGLVSLVETLALVSISITTSNLGTPAFFFVKAKKAQAPHPSPVTVP
jgi:hypothetical protein